MTNGNVYIVYACELNVLFQIEYQGEGVYSPIPGSCVKLIIGEEPSEILDAHATRDIFATYIDANDEINPPSLYGTWYNKIWRV